ncbi:MAG: glycosyltransferase family 4 protein [Bacteroidaceae bacterium]|nr:glycosyltransferase family 4 protein [Bacteroidaceae bacterium]
MKILLVNTSERTGGAAVACSRLMNALRKQGIDAKMLVRDKQSDNPQVSGLGLGRWSQLWKFVWERIVIWKANHFKKNNLFSVDIANTGTDITTFPEFKEADIIHLHWINQGMLSLKNLERIFESGKPVVWTMHDLWPATGICHHPRECDHYHTHCHNCPLLLYHGSKHDLSYRTFKKKQKLMQGKQVHFVACSEWLKSMAEKGALLQGQSICCIPNPLNLQTFKPKDRQGARQRLQLPTDKKLLLFGAVKATDKRKGIDYLIKACRLLVKQDPALKEQVGIVTFGMLSEGLRKVLPFEVYPQGYVADEDTLTDIYSAVNAYVTPSLEENLPNTIMEAMACGTPCVGFRVGGIPEMIDHKLNGYVADYKSVDDLAEGIRWIFSHKDIPELRQQTVLKVQRCYDENVVVPQFIELYQNLL